jgi:hypothetical protein
MICNARVTGHFLACRDLKAGYRPPRKPNGGARKPHTEPENKKPPVFAHSPRRAENAPAVISDRKGGNIEGPLFCDCFPLR